MRAVPGKVVFVLLLLFACLVHAGPRSDLLRVRASPGGRLWVVGAAGASFPIDDPRESQEFPRVRGTAPWNDVCFADDARGWIAGVDGVVLSTVDGGMRWHRGETPGAPHLFALACRAPELVVVAGDWGTIWVSDAAGWRDRSLDEDVVLYGVVIPSRDVVWVVGERGTILRSADRGARFRAIESPVEESLFAGFGEGRHGLAVGFGGAIVRTEDGGLTWKRVPSPTRESLYDVALDGEEGFAVGDRGVVLRTEDGGERWRIVDLDGTSISFLHGVALTPERAVAVGADGAIRRLR